MRLRLPHKAVYWPPLPPDEFASPTLGTPVELRCRWVDKESNSIAPDGSVTRSTATVTLEEDVETGGMLMLGALTELEDSSFPDNPRDEERVLEILSVQRTPNLKGTQTVYVVQV